MQRAHGCQRLPIIYITGWKPPARAPGSQPSALYKWPRVACMHSGTARTFLPYISHRKALLISPRSTVLQLQVALLVLLIAAGRARTAAPAAHILLSFSNNHLLIVTRLRETSVKLRGSEKLYKTKTVVQKISDLY